MLPIAVRAGERQHGFRTHTKLRHIQDWLKYLAFECGGTAIPEEARTPGPIDDCGDIAVTASATDTLSHGVAISEAIPGKIAHIRCMNPTHR
jgi:hypothetical protein